MTSEMVEIGEKSGNYICIKVNSRCYPQATDYWDGNWLNAEIHVRYDTLQTKVQANLRSDEFNSFFKELEPMCESLKGTAKFKAMEEWITMEIDGDGTGTFIMKGSVKGLSGVRKKVDFSIPFDKTELAKIIYQIKDVLRKFPVVAK